MAKRNALGKGLGALIENPEVREKVEKAGFANLVEIDQIEVNPFQPRSEFDEEAMNELTASIEKLGIIQPLTLREVAQDRYQIIAGERRFRAAKLVGLEAVPAYIRTADDQNMLEMALVENIQREDLNAIEVAMSYKRLVEECKLTQEDLGERVGKKRATVTNYMRLLKLPAEIQVGIKDKLISMGHARALIAIEDENLQLRIFYKIVDQGLSVRKTEEMVRDAINPPEKKIDANHEPLPEEYESLKSHLANYFKAKVDFKKDKNGSGKIIISFKTDDELQQIITNLDKIKG
ncbi:MAG: ParB/RepB/Spo0J family partition protein [Bacteroidota bacterium]